MNTSSCLECLKTLKNLPNFVILLNSPAVKHANSLVWSFECLKAECPHWIWNSPDGGNGVIPAQSTSIMGHTSPCRAVFHRNFLLFMAYVYRAWELLCRIAPLLSSITTYSDVSTCIHDFNQNHADSLSHLKTVWLHCLLAFMCVCVWVWRCDSCWWCYMTGWNLNRCLDMYVCLQ